MYDCVCSNVVEAKQTLFLGLSVQQLSAQVGWNSAISELTVTLVEDDCPGDKCCYDSNDCLNEITWSDPDPGFHGEPRWERPDGTQYSNCAAIDAADTQIRPGINLEGVPVYFRLGDFEWCGMVSDWIVDCDCDGGRRYRVKIVDPRVVLQNVQLIINDYPGCVTCEPCCPNPNLMNVYGFMENVNGVPCTPYGQVDPCNNALGLSSGFYDSIQNILADPTRGLSTDQLVFGTAGGGFCGACANDNGMPLGNILSGFNFLANDILNSSLTFPKNCYSPYGRVVFCKPSYFPDANNPTDESLKYGLPDGHQWCSIMPPDEGVNECFDKFNYYLVDLSELLEVIETIECATTCDGEFGFELGDTPFTKLYRISGTSISLMDLIEQLSLDFGFQYYIDLVPVKIDGEIIKFIKLRVINRRTGAENSEVCNFLTDSECVTSYSLGRELQTDTTSRFVIGGKKQTLYQAKQDTNPDGNFTFPANDGCTLVGYATNNLGQTFEVATPVCCGMDNTIIPYMGCNETKDLVPACQINGQWCWALPLSGLVGDLNASFFTGSTATVCEGELRSALAGYDTWRSYIYENATETYQAIFNGCGRSLTPIKGRGAGCVGRDAANPVATGFAPLDKEACLENTQTIYNWVAEYARQYYGRQWAVRVPFTCCCLDVETNQPKYSELPTNDGGWTEVCEVLGLRNHNNPLARDRKLSKFKSDEGKVLPFVCFPCGILKDTSNLSDDDYFTCWYGDSSFLAASTIGLGPPSGAGSASNCVYLDDISGELYIWNGSNWLISSQIPIYPSIQNPTVGIRLQNETVPPTPFFWFNTVTCTSILIKDIEVIQDVSNTTDCHPPQILNGTGNIILDPDIPNDDDNISVSGDLDEIDCDQYCAVGVVDDFGSNVIVRIDALNENNIILNSSTVTAASNADGFFDICVPSPFVANTIRMRMTVTSASGIGTFLGNISVRSLTNTSEPEPGLFVDDLSRVPGTVSSNLYVKATVETDYKFHDYNTCYVPRVIVSTPAPIFQRDPNELYGIKGGVQIDRKKLAGAPGAEDAFLPEVPPACMPNASAIPMVHENITYGPWCNPSNPGFGGEVIQDDSYVPWNFGSYADMNFAGVVYACAGRKDIKGIELGNITVPGYPTLPLGAELGAMGGGGQYLLDSRTESNETLTYDAYISGPGQPPVTVSGEVNTVDYDNAIGPNISSINVSIDANCNATTTYSFRSYTPRNGGFDRRLLQRLQVANRNNRELIKKFNELRSKIERLEAFNR